MVIIVKMVLLSCVISIVQGNATKVSRKDVFLSRRKRYLTFPKGSNFILTLSLVKSILQIQPRGWNILFEMDFPFTLPNDTRFFKNKKRHSIERRGVYSQLSLGMTGNRMNGTACVQRMICDSQKYIASKGKSLLKDLLLALFTYTGGASDEEYHTDCSTTVQMECCIPFLDYVIKSVENGQIYNA